MNLPAVEAPLPSPTVRSKANRVATRIVSAGDTTLELLGLVAIVGLAVLLRFHDLASRGTWDSDQGHDMIVLEGFVRSGIWPLLGPPTSIGDFHHGPLYYYLLAPSAWLGGGDPAWVVGEIALSGVAAVAVTWWLARSMAGPLAGLTAALLLGVSATAVEGSTFIWNPNLIALSSAFALAGAWRAWTTHSARWWLVAAAGMAVTMQCHVLGIVMLPPLAALMVADARREGQGPSVARVAIASVALIVASYVPLIVHELQTNLQEANNALAFLRSGGSAVALDPLSRVVFAALRLVSWPLVGLVTDAPIAALLALAAVVGIIAWRWRAPLATERTAVRWLGLTLLWSTLALGLGTAGLATVVQGLPVDHYHAFLDPLIVVIVGIGVARLWEARPPLRPGTIRIPFAGAGPALASVALVALVTWNTVHQPPPVARDGGYPAALAAAIRIDQTTGDRRGLISSLPAFKPAEAYVYPLERIGSRIEPEQADQMGRIDSLAIVCDGLFTQAIGAACQGPAEDRLAATLRGFGGSLGLADRFQAAPARWISVYLARP